MSQAPPPAAPPPTLAETLAGYWASFRALSFIQALASFGAWCRRQPVQASLLGGLVLVLLYFFASYHVFTNGRESVAVWVYQTWNPENDLEHGWLVLPAALFVVWYHRAQLAAAPKGSSWWGLVITVFGALVFLFAARTLQPRVAIFAFPFLCYGMVLYLWGKATARLVLFPCAFIVFMVPIGFLVSSTVALQTLTAAFAAKLAGILGVAVTADGDQIQAVNGAFHFEVAGGCSGVRSLTAMTMLAAMYVHFTQRTLTKKLLIFCSSLFFALLGNLMRIFTVVLFAHFISPKIAATLYHDYSGFIFFPIAVGAMVAFSGLVNADWSYLWQPDAPAQPATSSSAPAPGRPRDKAVAAAAAAGAAPAAAKRANPISYDY